MTRIYAAGVKATAIANIKADVAGFISFNSDGAKVLDTEGLVQYLETQFAAISTDAEYIAPATAATSAAAAKTVPTRAMVNTLDGTIGAAHWALRNDFPTTTTVLSGGILVAAVKAAIAELTNISNAITNYYNGTANRIKTALDDYFLAQGVDSSVPAGVARLIDTRFYLQTFVTDKGEESAPSPVSDIIRPDQNDTVTITRAAPPAGRSITHYRLYRSNSGSVNDAFQYLPNPADVDGWPIATATVLDDLDPTELQGTLQTLGWDEPPATLQGIVAGVNGGMAGFVGNVWHPCVNFAPYAYRAQDRKTTEHPIVAQGVAGNTYVVLTRGHPYFMTGPDVTAIEAEPRHDGEPCVSAQSVVSMAGGVVYACPDGICFARPGAGFRLVAGTQQEGGFNLFSREDWQALVPSSIFAAESEGCYVFHYNNGVTTGTYSLDLETGKLGTVDGTGSAFYRDDVTDTLYRAEGTTIKAMFASATRQIGHWTSKDIMLSDFPNLKWMRVVADFSDPVTVNLYGTKQNNAEQLLKTYAVTDREPLILPPGRFDQFRLDMTSKARVTSLAFASSTRDLKQA